MLNVKCEMSNVECYGFRFCLHFWIIAANIARISWHSPMTELYSLSVKSPVL